MRACSAILLAAGAVALLATSAPTSVGRSGAVAFLTRPVRAVQGSAVRATVVLSRPVLRCTGTLRHGRKGSTKVAAVVRLRASFTWKLAATAAPGVWSIGVACGVAGSTSASFRVTRRTPPPPALATVAVDRTGFSVAATAAPPELSYGVVLRNSSPDRDAIGVTVTVNVVDAANGVLKTDTTQITGIPAATTYYLGNALSLDAGAAPASLAVAVHVDSGQARRLALPPITNVRAIDVSGEAHVDGEFSNPYTKPMSSFTRITSVVFDPAGNVIGGGVTFPAAPVPPSGRVTFDLPVVGVDPARIGSVQGSVEPTLG
jgi:hypothetical protein